MTTSNNTIISVIDGKVAVKFNNPTIRAFGAEYKNGWFVFNRYLPLSATDVAWDWAQININSTHNIYDKCNNWREAGDKLGCSCAALSKQVRGAMYRVWIKPIRREAYGMAVSYGVKGGKFWNSEMLSDLHESRPDMPAYPENMRMFALLKSRLRLEAELGPERWDILVKNNFYRNCYICKRILAWINRTSKQFYLDGRLKAWDFVLSIPSTILANETKIAPHFFCDCVIKYTTSNINIFSDYKKRHPKVPMKDWQDYSIANNVEVSKEEEWEEIIF